MDYTKEIERIAESAINDGELSLAVILFTVAGALHTNSLTINELKDVCVKFSKQQISNINSMNN